MEFKVKKTAIPLLLTVMLGLAACGEKATLAVSDGIGPQPNLPQPNKTLIPTVHVLEAKGWPEDAIPIAASGFSVKAFAVALDHPRWQIGRAHV